MNPPAGLPPQNSEAEKGLLGSILREPAQWFERAAAEIREDTFYLPSHQTIWEAMAALRAAGRNVDYITLTNALQDAGQLEAVGGARVVSDLYTFTPTAANAEHYLEIVEGKAARRRVLAICRETTVAMMDEGRPTGEALDETEKRILEATRQRQAVVVPAMREAMTEVVEAMQAQWNRRGQLAGLSTGLGEVDRIISGLRGSELILVAGRSSAGKSALGMQWAAHAARAGTPAAIFSLEMSRASLLRRLLCSTARVSGQNVRTGSLGEGDILRLNQAAATLAGFPLLIDDTPSLTVGEIRSRAHRLYAQRGMRLLVVDCLQLCRSESHRARDNRETEIREITAGLKALAKELHVPVVALCQLNHAVEDRGEGRPHLSDLREFGALEQTADIVALLSRTDHQRDDDGPATREGESVLDIAKQRNGPTGEAKLVFFENTTRFEDRTPEPA